MKPDPGIFARRGDRVTDGDGTVVAIVKRDLSRHSTVSAADFAWIIDIPTPRKGEAVTQPGFRTLPDGRPQVCIEGQWRPVLSPVGG
jgi:hypothetical protein